MSGTPVNGNTDGTVPPVSCDPVNLYSGHKVERATDLEIPVTGGAFVFQREYTSDVAYLGASASEGNLVGRGWSASPFCGLAGVSQAGSDPMTITLHGFPLHKKIALNRTGTAAPYVWTAGGPATQTLKRATLTIDGVTVQVWRLAEPGGREFDFVAAEGASVAGMPEAGLLIQERDEYGNANTYQYYNTADTSNARLRAIYLNGTPKFDPAEAIVVFSWHTPTQGASISGRLDKLEVLRRDAPSSNTWKKTHIVDYTYATQVTSSSLSTEVGSGADLVQVATETLVDGNDSPYYKTITQYRYHGGRVMPADPDERVNASTIGVAGQLKAVLRPQQIEFIAQLRHQTLDAAAAYLLNSNDWDQVYPVISTPAELRLIDLASKIIAYETVEGGPRRVVKQYLQTPCGCSGGSNGAQGVREDYSYLSWTGSGGTGFSTAISERFRDAAGFYTNHVRTRYTDMELRGGVPYEKYSVVTETATSRSLVTSSHYDPFDRLTKRAMPSTYLSYTPARINLGVPVAPVASERSDGGLVDVFVYNSQNRLIERRIDDQLGTRAASDATLIEVTAYGLVDRPWLPTSIKRYRTSTTTPAPNSPDVEETLFEYAFYGAPSGPGAISVIKTVVERELETENGPGGTVAAFQIFDARGRLSWTRAGDGSLAYRSYDANTGAMIQEVANAQPAGVSGVHPALNVNEYPGLSALAGSLAFGVSDGGWLQTNSEVDILGRVRAVTTPGGPVVDGVSKGVRSGIRRELRTIDSRPAPPGGTPTQYLTTVAFPPRLSTGEFSGPATVTWFDAGGVAIGTSSFVVNSSSAGPDNPPNTYSFTDTAWPDGGEVSRERVKQLVSGAVSEREVWWYVSGGSSQPSTPSYVTTYEYDALGRLIRTVTPNGTWLTKTYDGFDRVLSEGIGTFEEPVSTVAEYFYDSDGTASNGVGNGNLTLVRRSSGETSPLALRETRRFYDHRNRLSRVVNAEPPHELFTYDNLNRVLTSSLYSSDAASPPTSARGRYSETAYSQRGLAYRTRSAIQPTESSPATSGFLESHSWYDSVGRVIAAWAPSGPGSKQRFDGLGRVVRTWVTDRGGDPAPGAAGNFEAAADPSLAGDIVFEQSQTRFAGPSEPWAGLPLVTSSMQRRHDLPTTVTGDLEGTPGQPTYSPATFNAVIYDDVNRPIRVVNLGTNLPGGTVLAPQGAPPSIWPPVVIPEPTSAPSDQLVSAISYNQRGFADVTTDPSGVKTRPFHDHLGRVIATMENYTVQASNVPSVVWSESSGHWKLVNHFDAQSPDASKNRTTSTVHDWAGRPRISAAHTYNALDSGPQLTRYEYSATSVGAATVPTSHLIASKDLLTAVRYPNDASNVPGSDPDIVTFNYNRLGELRATTDQRGVIRQVHLDRAGRAISDVAHTIPSTSIDGAVRRLDTTYDAMGRLRDLVSHGAVSSDQPKNAVRFSYTPLWQVAKIYQDHNGAIQTTGGSDGPAAGDTQVVEHGYDTVGQVTGVLGNRTRRVYTIYPDLTQINSQFESPVDNRISRLSGIKFQTGTSATVAKYGYMGLGTHAYVDLPMVDVQLDRTLDPPGAPVGTRRTPSSGNPGIYPAFDRFGRLRTQAWVDGSLGPGPNSSVPSAPPIFYERYSYDNASNRLDRADMRPGAVSGSEPTETFSYDKLHRLTQMDRSRSSIPVARGEKWRLDALGNWEERRQDLNGDGDFSDVFSVDSLDTREFTVGNEIDERLVQQPGAGQSGPRTITHDAAGNITESGTASNASLRHTYDAWNRLVKVESVQSGGALTSDRGVYEYNALHWRTASLPGGMLPAQTRLFYYDESWRLLEQHVRVVPPLGEGGGSQPFHYVIQTFYGNRHIDDPILRRVRNPYPAATGTMPDRWNFTTTTDTDYLHLTDADFSTRAILTPGGKAATVVERVRFTPYGEPEAWSPFDVDRNGSITSDDSSLVTNSHALIGTANYRSDLDVNRDGSVDDDDYTIVKYALGEPTPLPGELSVRQPVGNAAKLPLDNDLGFAGYVHLPGTGLYLSRHRVYDPRLGRWLQRDPAGYVDGMSLYEYCGGGPVGRSDPMGLEGLSIQAERATARELLDRARLHQAVDLIPPGTPIAAWERIIENARLTGVTSRDTSGFRLDDFKRRASEPSHNMGWTPEQTARERECVEERLRYVLERYNAAKWQFALILGLWEPADYAMSARDFINDPYDWTNWVGLFGAALPIIPGRVTKELAELAESSARAFVNMGESATRVLKAGEAATLKRLVDHPVLGQRFKGLRPAPEGSVAFDFIDDFGTRIEQIGNPKASLHWNEEKFIKALNDHLISTGDDVLVIDVTGFKPEHVAVIRNYLDSGPPSSPHEIIRIGFD